MPTTFRTGPLRRDHLDHIDHGTGGRPGQPLFDAKTTDSMSMNRYGATSSNVLWNTTLELKRVETQ